MSTQKFDLLPEAGRRLARIPRYGRLLACLPEARFDGLRNEATALWEAYMYVGQDRNATGLFDDGLKPEQAKRLGCHEERDPVFDAPTTRHWQVRLACDLTAAIAFEMTFGDNSPRTSVGNIDGLLQHVRTRRLKPTGAYCDIDGEPIPLSYFKLRDWPRLQAMNTRGLSFLLFHDTSAELRFIDRTTQMFFAACWIARWGTEEDRAAIHQRIPAHGPGADDDPHRQYLEFWQLLAELPAEATRKLGLDDEGECWVRAVAPLYQPGDGTAAGTRRNCELIYRAWDTLETLAAPARQVEEARRMDEAARTKRPPPRGVEGLRPGDESDSRGADVSCSAAELAWRTLVGFQAEFAEQCLSGNRGAGPQAIAEEFIAGFRPIPPGEFLMGSPESEAHRWQGESQHGVRLTRAFELHQHQTTNAVFQLFMPGHVSGKEFDAPRRPVVGIDWYHSWCFAKWVCWDGRSCRLPTEAEWEYACRAGTTTPFHFGETDNGTQSNIDECFGRTTDVGTFPANGFGLHDMHGNVTEWCADWSGDYPVTDVAIDPEGPRSGSDRVVRGGSWVDFAWNARSAWRDGVSPNEQRYTSAGFRVARTR